jgi:hypothetical protein
VDYQADVSKTLIFESKLLLSDLLLLPLQPWLLPYLLVPIGSPRVSVWASQHQSLQAAVREKVFASVYNPSYYWLL